MREPPVRRNREAGGVKGVARQRASATVGEEPRTACPRPQELSQAHPPCTTNGNAWNSVPSTPSTTSCSSSSSARRLPMRSARGDHHPPHTLEKQGSQRRATHLGLRARLAPDSRLNPHRSLLGTGNYDVNVIMAALQGQGLAAVWWDRRRPLSQLALPQVLGLILNLPSPVSLGLLSLPLRRRHWVALRQVGGVYYNLDSKLRTPEVLGNEDGVRPPGGASPAHSLTLTQ
ncbi:josephin-2 isoform X2 [Phacochoerus africanus]|uniref:josephin-2 isoform X2 n=1 Tax=Phacochoerus africanus TaxID=41426 RepID=UPI001FD9E7BE|nr:josephin-2 isoform X2 [Phacochoerus africanus]XP_047646138.1 josephin-2 isoform X2 [Phacochoerus africanus]XP_047646140.1 josephin-2 isoform X2 [Phacochoerus africanus]